MLSIPLKLTITDIETIISSLSIDRSNDGFNGERKRLISLFKDEIKRIKNKKNQ